jgi:sarcosine oxidase, subunit beta
MSRSCDAIIIGAGIIGAAVGLELARKGWKTLNVDMAPAAGYGSTSGSCAIIRTHYSTLEGTAFAYDGFFYWKHWRDYLGVDDERGLAEFRQTGCMVMKTEANKALAGIKAHQDALGIPYEDLDAEALRRRLPYFDFKRFHPPKRPDDAAFGEPTGGELPGAVFFPCAGYITDPQLAAHNLQRAAEAAGGTFLFNRRAVAIAKDAAGRVTGVTLDDGTTISAPVVVNVGGPHSYKINEMAGATADMKIKTRALKQEVVHVPMPVDNYDEVGMVTSDSDIACYTRPEKGGFLLVGSEDPPCDPREWVDPDDYDRNFSEQWRVQALRAAQRLETMGQAGDLTQAREVYATLAKALEQLRPALLTLVDRTVDTGFSTLA